MTVHHFIAAKRKGRAHSPEELQWFVSKLTQGEIADDHASAWLMAAYLNGLDEDETAALTQAMADSGERLSLPGLPHPVIDKHSTGGVGDAVTLIFLPLTASCGVPVVKLAGGGLGFTGGTLDKLAEIPGFRTDLTPEELAQQAREVGCALGGHTAKLAPADKTLYALRDATGTVDSIPLIAASVMSKKLAAGADVIVLDVKVGSGAFMGDAARARELARTMVAVGERAGKRVRAILTDMSQPLARAVGNALEVRAAIDELKAGCEGRLGRVARALTEAALESAGTGSSVEQAITSGRALEKMRAWIEAQGGDPRVVDEPQRVLPQAPVRTIVLSRTDGYVARFETGAIGAAVRELGAGWREKDAPSDPAVGLEVHTQIGDRVAKGDAIFTVHARTEAGAEAAAQRLSAVVSIATDRREPPELIISSI